MYGAISIFVLANEVDTVIHINNISAVSDASFIYLSDSIISLQTYTPKHFNSSAMITGLFPRDGFQWLWNVLKWIQTKSLLYHSDQKSGLSKRVLMSFIIHMICDLQNLFFILLYDCKCTMINVNYTFDIIIQRNIEDNKIDHSGIKLQ